MLRTIERLNMPYISLELMMFLRWARRRRKFFKFMVIKLFWDQKFMVPPPGRIENFQFLPKTYFSPGILKSEFPPRQNPKQNPDFSPKFWGEMTLWWYSILYSNIPANPVKDYTPLKRLMSKKKLNFSKNHLLYNPLFSTISHSLFSVGIGKSLK